MDFLDSPYCRINRLLASSCAIWPYQDGLRARVQGFIFTGIFLSGAAFQLTAFATHKFSFRLLCRIITYTVPKVIYILKYFTFSANLAELRKAFEMIRFNWKSLTNEEEQKIIMAYANKGRLLTILFIRWVAFVLCPFIPHFLDAIAPLNESRTRRVPIIVEYFLDEQKYFNLILLHLDICDFLGATVVIVTEATFMVLVQHACGLFKIVSYRYDQMVEDSISDAFSQMDCCYFRKGIRDVVRLHQRAIEFTDAINDALIKYYFVLMAVGVVSLSVNLFLLLNTASLMEMLDEVVISFVLVIIHFGYMFYCNYFGQEMLDHSTDVFSKIYNTRWYMAPMPLQKLLFSLMQRSMNGCAFVTGGIFTPSFAGFSTLASTSLSYFTLLYSVR